MGRSGYVKLYRSILDNPATCKDADYLAVWVYLLLNATFCEQSALFCNDKITLKPGQMIIKRADINVKLGVSVSKIQRILKAFENEHQIEQQTSNQNRLISICRWSDYQSSETQNETQMKLKRNSDETQMKLKRNSDEIPTLYKESKKERKKEGKKEKYGEYDNVLLTPSEFSKLTEEYPDYQERIDRLSGYIASKGDKYKSHYATIRNWARKDAATVDKQKGVSFLDL